LRNGGKLGTNKEKRCLTYLGMQAQRLVDGVLGCSGFGKPDPNTTRGGIRGAPKIRKVGGKG